MKPKRILIICVQFPPQPSIASLRAYSFAKYWARMGNDVTVITTKKIDRGALNLSLPTDKFSVIEVPYFNIYYTANKYLKVVSKLNRGPQGDKDGGVIEEISAKRSMIFSKIQRFAKKISNKYGILITNSRMPNIHDPWAIPALKSAQSLIKLHKIDWVFSSYGPPVVHIVAGLLRKKFPCRWVADYRDLWNEGHIYPGMWPFTIIERYLENKYVGARADIITTVSEPLADTLRGKYSTPVHVIENGFDEEDYEIRFNPYFKEKKIRLVYTGTIYPEKQDPSPLFAAINMLVRESKKIRRKIDDGFEVLFFGSSNEWLTNLIYKYQVQQWVKYKGMVNRNDALRIQYQANLLLFLEWDYGSEDGILTGKLFEYLAMRKPILGVGVNPNTSAGTLMEKSGLGLAVGNDVDKIRCVLLNFIEKTAPFPVLPNEEVIQRYTRRKLAERLLRIMD